LAKRDVCGENKSVNKEMLDGIRNIGRVLIFLWVVIAIGAIYGYYVDQVSRLLFTLLVLASLFAFMGLVKSRGGE
jgi:hypothetical protein